MNEPKPRPSRRKFLKNAARLTLSAGFAGLGYSLLEAKWVRIARVHLPIKNLPRSFQGTTISLITDVHHGPFVPLSYVRDIVAMSNALKPDIVALSGDYVSNHPMYIEPSLDALGDLKASFGRFAVLGNHDHWESAIMTRAGLAEAKISLVENTGLWLTRGKDRLRIGGVGDYWEGTQDLDSALGDCDESGASLILSHNPDFVEEIFDQRVGLVLSGHTHGGQVVVPGYGAPLVPSSHGQKYLHGLVQGPKVPVFVSRGVGTVTPPVRFRCRPEIVHITLSRAVTT